MVDDTKIASVHAAIASLQKLSELFSQRRTQLAGYVGLTEQQWLLLEKVSDAHFMPSMFARDRESSPAAVSKIIRQLMDKGLISVSIKQKDGRQRQYSLTSKGNETMEKLRLRREEAIEAIWMKMNNDELDMFAGISDKLIEAIEKYAATEK